MGRADKITNELGIVGHSTVDQGWAVQASFPEGSGKYAVWHAGEPPSYKAEDGLGDVP